MKVTSVLILLCLFVLSVLSQETVQEVSSQGVAAAVPTTTTPVPTVVKKKEKKHPYGRIPRILPVNGNGNTLYFFRKKW
ncbi:CML21 [Acrasis kona]|uniref:CML21 n=1 Tax=Acrasis kona TaxID=1008807 RepID=A0AAW2Z6Z5_9EUKA